MLKTLRFDAALITTPERYWPHLLSAVTLGIPNRVCYVHKGLSGFTTHPMAYPFRKGHAVAFRDYVAGLTGMKPDWNLRPQIFLDKQDMEEAEHTWNRLQLSDALPVFAVFCTTRQPAEIWAEGKWAQCAQTVFRLTGAQVVFLGTREDRGKLLYVAGLAGVPAQVIAGDLSVRGLAAFLKKCSAILTPDSGARHIGNAVGTPVVFLRNLAVFEKEVEPYCDNEIDVVPHGSCLKPALQRKLLAQIDPIVVSNIVVGRMATAKTCGNRRGE